MPTPVDVLMNREQYPDDLEFEWMGEKHTLQTWRQNLLPMGEFTKVRQQASSRIQELEQTQLTLQQQLAAALNDRQQQQDPPATRQTGDGTGDDDPYIAPLNTKIRSLEQHLSTIVQKLESAEREKQEERKQQQLNQWWSQIGDLKKDHPDLDQETLVRFAASEGLRDMSKAYKLMTHDDLVKAAETRGFDRGQKTRPPAYIPGSKRGSMPASALPPTPVGSIQEAMSNALRDPDVQTALHGEVEA